MKRMISCAMLLCFSVTVIMPTAAQAVGTSASSAVLMEADSGRILYEENADEERLIASITKLMTALIAIERATDLEEAVTVTADCCGIEGSSLYLREGETITLEALLYGLLLRSGNDAACAVAVHTAGSIDAFVAMMNERAQQLGMTHTHFANPHGLNADGHYSSAHDMALLAQQCLKNETLITITSSKTAVFGERVFTNHNRLLWRCEGVIGLKTGYTEKAGRTLVSAAHRGGMTLIAVTLNDPDDWRDHAALYEYGFSNFAPVAVAEGDDIVAKIPVSGSLVPFVSVKTQNGCAYPLNAEETLERNLDLEDKHLTAPVDIGDHAGTLSYSLNGEEVISIPLSYASRVACNLAPEQGFFSRLIGRFFS